MSRSPSIKEKDTVEDARKVFVTNIDGTQPEEIVEAELRRLFQRFGSINKLNVKKNKNGLYCFGFIEFEKAEAANTAIKELDQYQIFGKRMRVRQDRQNEGCFHCKKTGHFARECPENKDSRQRDNRSNYPDERERGGRDYRERGYGRDYRDRERSDRYRMQRQRDQRGYRRDYEHRRRRSPSRSSRSHSKEYPHRRDYSSDSERVRYGAPRGHRHYYERDNRDRSRDHRRDQPRRRRDSSYSRSNSRSSGR